MSANIICLICFGDYHNADEVVSTECGHIFHKNCLQNWIIRSPTCPQCRDQCTSTKRIFPQFSEASSNSKLKEELQRYKKSFKVMQENLFESENINAELLDKFALLQMESDEQSRKNKSCLKNIENMKQQAAKDKNTLSSVQNELERFKYDEIHSRSLIKILEDELNNLGKQLDIQMNLNYQNPKDELRVQIINLIKNVSYMVRVHDEKQLQKNAGNNRQPENAKHWQQEHFVCPVQSFDFDFQKYNGTLQANFPTQQMNHNRQQENHHNPNVGGNAVRQKRRNFVIPIIDPKTREPIDLNIIP